MEPTCASRLSRAMGVCLALASLLGITVGAASAQTTPETPAARVVPLMAADETTVLSLLRSTDARERAWGAWYASVYRVAAAAPALQDLALASLGAAASPETDAVLDAALDALIQLQSSLAPGQQVKEGFLLQTGRKRPVQATVLSSLTMANPSLYWMGLLGNQTGGVWFAAANLMVMRAPQTAGLAMYLMTGLRVEATLFVQHGKVAGPAAPASALPPPVMSSPAEERPPLEGFPPGARYELRPLDAPGVSLLAGGPAAVAYSRNLVAPGTGGEAPSASSRAETADRLAYLAMLAGLPAAPLSARESRTVKWVDQETFDVDLATFQLDIRDRHLRLAQALLANRRLTAREASSVPEPVRPVSLERVSGRIELRNVGFRYGSRTVTRGVNLAIEPGEMIGLVGHSGSGKSTLVNLICRFYDVTEGAVLVDGVDVRSLPVAEYRRSIGLVLQEPFLFFGTIADNIAYGKPQATREEIVAAARAAHAHDFILRLPHGYDSLVGERGQALSGGERQRISIARALLIDPRILILDEATSSVDTQTEKEIQRALDNLVAGRTTIAIAHRLSTLRRADRLVVLDRGQVVEVGAHEELMAREGAYFRLYQAQARNVDTEDMLPDWRSATPHPVRVGTEV